MTLWQWLTHLWFWLRMFPHPFDEDGGHTWHGEFDPEREAETGVAEWDCLVCGAHMVEEGWYGPASEG